jgi:hypothetical protein
MLDCPAHIHSSPTTYARQLAGYISDPSTIRARTLEMFGRAPSVEQVEKIKSRVEAEHDRQRYFNPYMHPKYDGHAKHDFKLPPPPKPLPPIQLRPLPAQRTWPTLIAAIATDFDLETSDIVGQSRKAHVVRARRLVCQLLRDRGNSFGEIGKRLGGRDHSTIRHACLTFEAMAKRDPKLRAAYRHYSEGVGG